MRRIRDRVILGVVAGLIGNGAKTVVSKVMQRLGHSELGGATRAMGMLVPAHKIATPGGWAVGYIADNAIACMLGTVGVYALAVSGTDHALIKGGLSGGAAWTALYGVLGRMGATNVTTFLPKTVLSELLAHTVFGVTAAGVAVTLGDPQLFNGGVPISATPQKEQPSPLTAWILRQ